MNAHARNQQMTHMPIKFGFDAAYYGLNVHGGPFDKRPKLDTSFNVCVRAEQVPKDAIHAHLPIEDFHVPEPEQLGLVNEVLFRTFKAAIDGKHVYVGCMGGIGRTGLLLALIAKTAGEKNPVPYVRKHYDRRAVETGDQQQYIARFDVGPVRQRLFWYAWSHRMLWSWIGN